jgi:hypothetical protein
LNDAKAVARDVSNLGHWGIGDYVNGLFMLVAPADRMGLAVAAIFRGPEYGLILDPKTPEEGKRLRGKHVKVILEEVII